MDPSPLPAPPASADWYRQLVENSQDITTVLGADGQILYDSPAVARVLGYRQGALVGRSALELVHPEDLSCALELLVATVAEPGRVGSLVVRFRHGDGSWRLLECVGTRMEHPTADALVVTSRDVTGRVAAGEPSDGARPGAAARGEGWEAAQLEMLERLARAAELRDDDTGQHTRRVGELAARIARAMGRPESEIALLRVAAPLHDVGKIGIPDAILRKRSHLSESEIRIMRTHTLLGARLLAGGRSALMRASEQIALCHHERWDGAGYPAGLRAAEIPLPARIVAAADVYDALSHTRPYRAAQPAERVLQCVREGRGAHFDPDVADALLSLHPEHHRA